MAVAAINNWLQAGQPANGSRVHRQLLIICGTATECYMRAQSLLATLPDHISSCWAGPGQPTASRHVELHHARHVLGQEFDIVVYDAHQPFRPSAFLALAGTVKKGGRIIMLMPSFGVWQRTPAVLDTHYLSYGVTLDHSPYLRHIEDKLRAPQHHGTIAYWSGDDIHLPVAAANCVSAKPQPPFYTVDQAKAYAATQQAMRQPNSAIVLTAPRGRGKSALLGLLAADLLRQGINVTLTSPVSLNTQAIFTIAKDACAGQLSEHRSPRLTEPNTGAVLQWYAPDSPALLNTSHRYLLIDEAAALPLPVTKKLVKRSTNSIVATTTLGYEGSGQGFITRFLPWLAEHNAVSHYALSLPIRWFEKDPLERFCEDALLFAESDSRTMVMPANTGVQWSLTSFDALHENQLRQAIQLLTLAHYQTTPDDIMRLIDAPDSFLILGMTDKRVIAVCIINQEGGDTLSAVAENISRGERRVKGHLGAQRLALIAAEPALASLRYWRINRIAVLPDMQRNGIGTQCLAEVHKHARDADIDAITSSFGATTKLMTFWQQNGFYQVATGVKPDKASGERSALVVCPMPERCSGQFSYLHQLYNFDSGHHDVSMLFAANNTTERQCLRVLRDRLDQFRQGTRSFDQLGAAWAYYLTFSKHSLAPLLSHLTTLGEIAKQLTLSGKREANQVLQGMVAQFLQR